MSPFPSVLRLLGLPVKTRRLTPIEEVEKVMGAAERHIQICIGEKFSYSEKERILTVVREALNRGVKEIQVLAKDPGSEKGPLLELLKGLQELGVDVRTAPTTPRVSFVVADGMHIAFEDKFW